MLAEEKLLRGIAMVNEIIPGKVVSIRNRIWRVDDVDGNVLTATSLDGNRISRKRFYIPYEEIREIQPEVPGIEDIGSYSDNRLLIEANKLILMHSTAPFLSLQRTRIVPNQYQLVPLIMALDMEPVRLLIADDVGLGKTIEAGLICSELLVRQKIKNILVVCPASLREQWQDTLLYFFHIDAQIISTRHRKNLEQKMPPGASPWSFYNYLIVSMDYAKRPEIKSEILSNKWDMVIIDEAHLAARPHDIANSFSKTTDRYLFAKSICKAAKHLILMTATPHNGYTDSYASLFELLDIGAVAVKRNRIEINRDIAKKHVCQRRRKDVEEWFKQGKAQNINPFPERVQEEVVIQRQKDGIEEMVFNLIDDFGKKMGEIYGSSKALAISYWTLTHLYRRALSSPAALRISLINRINAIDHILKNSQITDFDEDNYDTYNDIEIMERESATKDHVFDIEIGDLNDDKETSDLTDRFLWGTPSQLLTERSWLERILQQAELITPSKDSKLQKLYREVDEILKDGTHIIIFTKYVNTLEYLRNQLESKYKKAGVKVITIAGGMNEAIRLDKYALFRRTSRSILIATDCLSEGINLQHTCNHLIHYELPWNPNRLEQRNGRIDRYGQPKEKVFIKTFVVDRSLDSKILHLLIEKAENIRKEYGFMPMYFSESNTIFEIIRAEEVDYYQLTIWDVIRQTGEPTLDFDPFSKEIINKVKEESFYGHQDVSFDTIEKKLQETVSKIGSKEALSRFCMNALNKFNCHIRQVDHDNSIFEIDITDDDLKYPNMNNRVSFNPEIGYKDQSVDVIDLGHPIIKRIIEKISYLKSRRIAKFGRISGIYTRKCENVTALYNVLVRYVVNSDITSVLEEILHIPIDVYNEKLMPLSFGEEIFNATPEDINVSYEQVKETAIDINNQPGINNLIEIAITDRLDALRMERVRMRKEISNSYLDEEIKLASRDILTIIIYYPV
ncbi:MAG: DEAD/DEAH box helicase [Clostridiaceae bacterium]|nr:DEAD/DEAH box helicase [Clostridiaceae bacterium]